MIPILMEKDSTRINLSSITWKFLSTMRPRQSQLFDQIFDLFVCEFSMKISFFEHSFSFIFLQVIKFHRIVQIYPIVIVRSFTIIRV